MISPQCDTIHVLVHAKALKAYWRAKKLYGAAKRSHDIAMRRRRMLFKQHIAAHKKLMGSN